MAELPALRSNRWNAGSPFSYPSHPMTVSYDRDDRRRLITVTVAEPYSVDDFISAIDRQSAEDTWDYAMLYDLRGVTHLSPQTELQHMADRIQVIGRGRARGPVGIAISPLPELFLVFLTYAQLTRESGTAEVLLTTAQLDAWLVRSARSGPSRPP
jgi:hypothetical protein